MLYYAGYAVLAYVGLYMATPWLLTRVFGWRVIRKGRIPDTVALTFDDGPDPAYTPRLLDLLGKHGIRATFFVLGHKAEAHPDLIRRIQEEGHLIGIHNYRHVSNWLLRASSVRKRQIDRTAAIVESITGVRPFYYRPPWGVLNLGDLLLTRRNPIVLWSVMIRDWNSRPGADTLRLRLLRRVKGGSVVLLHDSGATLGADPDAPQQMLLALEGALEEWNRGPLRFVRLDEFMPSTAAGGSQPAFRWQEAAAFQAAVAQEPQAESTAAPGRGTRLRDASGDGHPAPAAGGPAAGTATAGNSMAAAASTPDAPSGVPSKGWAKRAFVGLWMGWERLFLLLFRIRPVDPTDPLLKLRVRSYKGEPIVYSDGEQLLPGDTVAELHFDNAELLRLSRQTGSQVQLALQLAHRTGSLLPSLSRLLQTNPAFRSVKGLYGISIIHRGARRLGFTVQDLPPGWTTRLTQAYLRFLLTVLHPEGRKRLHVRTELLVPKLITMPASRLTAKYPLPPDRGERRERAECPPRESDEEGLFAGQTPPAPSTG